MPSLRERLPFSDRDDERKPIPGGAWSIFGDQRDSLSQLDCGWLQVYAEDAQESLDLMLQAYRIAEDASVLTPVMVNLDGFVLTHTYEVVEVPNAADVDKYLPPYKPAMKMDFEIR